MKNVLTCRNKSLELLHSLKKLQDCVMYDLLDLLEVDFDSGWCLNKNSAGFQGKGKLKAGVGGELSFCVTCVYTLASMHMEICLSVGLLEPRARTSGAIFWRAGDWEGLVYHSTMQRSALLSLALWLHSCISVLYLSSEKRTVVLITFQRQINNAYTYFPPCNECIKMHTGIAQACIFINLGFCNR